MIDSHAHYTHKNFSNMYRYLSYKDGKYFSKEGKLDDIFAEMKENGITAFVEPAIDIDSNYKIMDLYEKNKGFMYPVVGVHPTRAYKAPWERRLELIELAKNDSVVAIGETGLDYHYAKKDQHRREQKKWFVYQIELAYQYKLPLVLHIRMADKAALRILRRHRKKIVGGVVHCFYGNAKIAKKYAKLGFYFGIGGSLLQNNDRGASLQKSITRIPLDRILLETDAPFVFPCETDEAGTKLTQAIRNTSISIIPVAEEIARIKGITVEDIIKATENNTEKLFGLRKNK